MWSKLSVVGVAYCCSMRKMRIPSSNQEKPRSLRIGVSGSFLIGTLVGGSCGKHLPVAQGVDVAEHRRSGRQTRGSREVRVEQIVSSWNSVHHGATFEYSGVVGRVVK